MADEIEDLKSYNDELKSTTERLKDVTQKFSATMEGGGNLNSALKDLQSVVRSNSQRLIASRDKENQVTIQRNVLKEASKQLQISEADLSAKLKSLANQIAAKNTPGAKTYERINADGTTTQMKLSKTNAYLESQTRALQQAVQDELEQVQRYDEQVGIATKSLENLQKEQGTVTDKMKNLSSRLSELSGAFQTIVGATLGTRDKFYALQKELGTTLGTTFTIGKDAVLNTVKSIFGSGPALSFQDTIDAVNAYQKEFGTLLTGDSAKTFAQAAKKFGVDFGTYGKAIRSFSIAGYQSAQMQQKVINQFTAAGLTGKQALEFAAENANLIAIAGFKYADSLGRAAAHATKIGVSLGKTEDLADSIIGDFEGSIEKFSELASVGFDLDVNKLAEASASGNAELFQSTLQSELAKNKDLLTSPSRYQKLMLQQSMGGMNLADLQKLAGIALTPEQRGEVKTKPEESPESKLSIVIQDLIKVLSGIGIPALIAATVANTGATILNTLGTFGIRSSARGIEGMMAAGTKLPTGGGGEGLTSVSKGASSFGTGALKGAAAMLVVSASIWVLGKALQEFKNVNWDELKMAGAAIAGVGTAIFLGGLAIAQGGAAFSAGLISLVPGLTAIAAVIPEIVALTIVAMGLGYALGLAAPAINAFGNIVTSVFNGVATIIATVSKALNDLIVTLSGANANNIGAVGVAMLPLALGITALGTAGTIAAPGLAVLGTAAGAFGLLQKAGLLPTFGGTAVSPGTPVAPNAATSAPGAATAATISKIDTSRLEAKLDQVVNAIRGMKIQMNGHDVANISLNDRSPIFTASPARAVG